MTVYSYTYTILDNGEYSVTKKEHECEINKSGNLFKFNPNLPTRAHGVSIPYEFPFGWCYNTKFGIKTIIITDNKDADPIEEAIEVVSKNRAKIIDECNTKVEGLDDAINSFKNGKRVEVV